MRTAKAGELLSRHHSAQRSMGDGRSDGDKSDWLCKFCTTATSAPYKTYGNKVHCHKCGIAKGKAFLRVATGPAKPPTTSSLAESQKLVKKLQAELVANKVEARLRQPHKELEEQAADAEPAKGLSMEQLKSTRAMYLGFGDAGKVDVERLDAQIASLQEASLAKKPGSEHVRIAERRVARAKKACETGQEKLAALEKGLVDRASEKVLEDAELQDAEAAYQTAAKALQPEAETGPKTLGGMAAVCVGFSDDFFTRAKTTREQSQTFFALIAAEQKDIEKRQQEKDAAEATEKKELAKGQQERESALQQALDQTKSELARMQSEAARKAPDPILVGDVAASASDCSYAAVDALMADVLGTDGLDPAVKRAMEAKFDVLNKRRRTVPATG